MSLPLLKIATSIKNSMSTVYQMFDQIPVCSTSAVTLANKEETDIHHALDTHWAPVR
jgi:hypothetical protein